MAENGLILDGIFASEHIDTSGEVVDIRGLDISSLKNGEGVLNVEHINPGEKTEKISNFKGSSTFNTIIGHIIYAKKIHKESDCDNEREKQYWNKVKVPFIYGQVELFDKEDHPGAVAAAAMVRYYQKRKMPILLRFSIEGHTIKKDGNKIVKSLARAVALTIRPCNKSAVSGVLEDKDSKVTDKSIVKTELSYYNNEYIPFELEDLTKTMTAGGMDAAPSTLVNGSALQSEAIDKKKLYKANILAAARDWDGLGDFKSFIKAKLPETDKEFMDYFDDLSNDFEINSLRMRKSLESLTLGLFNLQDLNK